MTNTRQMFLLSIVAVLLVVKFIIVPVLDWQNEIKTEIENKSRQLAKMERATDNVDDYQRHIKELNQSIEHQLKLFYPFSLESKFKIDYQKRLEAIAAEHNVLLTNIGWNSVLTVSEQRLEQYEVAVYYRGETIDFARFIKAIESTEQVTNVKDLNMSFRGQRDEKLGKISGNFVLNFYMVKGESS